MNDVSETTADNDGVIESVWWRSKSPNLTMHGALLQGGADCHGTPRSAGDRKRESVVCSHES